MVGDPAHPELTSLCATGITGCEDSAECLVLAMFCFPSCNVETR